MLRCASPFAVVLALSLFVGTAQAQGSAPGGLQGAVRLLTASGLDQGVLEPGVILQGHTLEDSEGSRHYMGISEFQFGYGVSHNLEVGVSLPVRAWRASSTDTSSIRTNNHGGFGDLSVAGKLRLPLPGDRLQLAGFGRASFPTGSRSRGFSSKTTDYEAGGLLTLDFSDLEDFLPTRLHVNASYRWNRNEAEGVGMAPLTDITSGGFWPPAYPARRAGEGDPWNDQLLLRAGIDFSTRIVVLFTEFSVDWLPHIDELSFRDNVLFLTPGATVRFRNGLNLKMAADISLQDSSPKTEFVPELPSARLWLGLTWNMSLANRDRDHDGIPDKRDTCPETAEDYDGFEDDDGCPDLDNDGDGVPDERDLAPDLAEDIDEFEDEDGRPDLDNDGDGIADVRDECPNEPEDFDGDRDTDGCPDIIQDSDADGIPDEVDGCPDQPEDRDGFEDTDGCPDTDNDGDGILDPQDACPDAAETKNGYLDEDGCPDSALYRGGEILTGVDFETGSASLSATSIAALRPLLTALREDPHLQVELRGFTDNRGSAARNLELSEQRAAAVRDWLLAQGIAAHRVQARGLGAANPVASNDTVEGRARNRRIEVWGH